MFDCGANDITLSLEPWSASVARQSQLTWCAGEGGLYDWDDMGYSIAGIDDCAGKRTVLNFGGSP